MKNIKIGRITLSFTFISLGIVVFIEKYSHYKWNDLFSILWPAIIMFFGLEVMYVFLDSKKENNKSSQLDKASICLVSLLVIAIGIGTSMGSEYPDIKRQLKKQLKYKYRQDISEDITLNKNSLKRLIINDMNTDIIINRSDNQDVEVKLQGVYNYNKQKKNKASKFLNIENNGQIARVNRYIEDERLNFKKTSAENMRYSVYLPENVDIEVMSRYGDVFLDLKSNTTNNIHIRCDYGDVSLILPREQTGKFNIITTYGSIYDEFEFDVIESISAMTIDETRKTTKPNFDIRVNNGNIILKTD